MSAPSDVTKEDCRSAPVLLLDVSLALQSGRLSAGSDADGFVIDRSVSLISGRKGTFLLTSC